MAVAPPRLDPALGTFIERPGPFQRRRLRIAVPLVLWVLAAVGVVLLYGLGGTPPVAVLVILIGVGLLLLVLAGPTTLRSLREHRAALAVRGPARAGVERLQAGDPAAADALWRRALATPDLNPPGAAVLVHNLGVAALAMGDLPRARALMAHTWESGWVQSFVLRQHRAGFAQTYATVLGLLGEPVAASVALAEARAARPGAAIVPLLDEAELVMRLREEAWDAAAAVALRLDPSRLPPAGAQVTWLLAAYALDRADAPRAEVAAALERVGTLSPDQPAWAAAHWPELRAFAESQGLYTPRHSG